MSHGGRKIEGLPSNKWRDRLLGFFIVGFIIVTAFGVGAIADYREYINETKGVIKQLVLDIDEWRKAYEKCSRTDTLPIIMRLQSRLDPTLARQVADAIQKYSSEYKLPPGLVIHIIDRESRFRPMVRSKAGAVGLMQIMIKAHKDKLKEMGITPEEAYHVDNNIKLGCWIFREYFDKEKDIEKALTRYVGGNHEKYVKDILVAFTNESIVGVKDVQGMREVEEGNRGTEAENKSQRNGELEKGSTDSKNGTQSGTVDKRLGTLP